ncbi:MAG: type VII toxin-antitoxin system MntA family adenylyltransferase antitoxin [Spirochaetaceae bacterium]
MEPVSELPEVEAAVAAVLKQFSSLEFALLYGSAVTGRLRKDSDIDVAVYLDSGGQLEVEEEREFPEEAEIQIALERALGRNVEILLLNRAPATVCASAVETGRLVLLRNAGLYRRYALAVTDVAASFLGTEEEFRQIRNRSSSLAEVDRSRLERILDFISDELQDRSEFEEADLRRYQTDRGLRRSLDRWAETLINSAIDIGKIVLASEQRGVPQTYGQILAELEGVTPFDELQGRLKQLAPLRNVLAHEYLDLRFRRVKDFVEEGSFDVEKLASLARRWLEQGA